MRLAVQCALGTSAALFLYYGLSCLIADGMRAEFARYNLSAYRRLTGLLEVLGAVGLMASVYLPILVIPSALGLTLLMVLGVMTRLRVRDPFAEIVPAAVLLLINAFLVIAATLGVRAGR